MLLWAEAERSENRLWPVAVNASQGDLEFAQYCWFIASRLVFSSQLNLPHLVPRSRSYLRSNDPILFLFLPLKKIFPAWSVTPGLATLTGSPR